MTTGLGVESTPPLGPSGCSPARGRWVQSSKCGLHGRWCSLEYQDPPYWTMKVQTRPLFYDFSIVKWFTYLSRAWMSAITHKFTSILLSSPPVVSGRVQVSSILCIVASSATAAPVYTQWNIDSISTFQCGLVDVSLDLQAWSTWFKSGLKPFFFTKFENFFHVSFLNKIAAKKRLRPQKHNTTNNMQNRGCSDH